MVAPRTFPPTSQGQSIFYLLQKGTHTPEIAEQLGLFPGVVHMYAALFVKKEGLTAEEKLARKAHIIERLIQYGEKSLEFLCLAAHLETPQFTHLSKKYGLSLPVDLEPWKYQPEVDVYIEQGLPLEEIGTRTGRSRQAVHQYVQHSGQHSRYLARRKEVVTEVQTFK